MYEIAKLIPEYIFNYAIILAVVIITLLAIERYGEK